MESGRDRVYACVVFVLAASLYYATLTGITCSNDGSHYALVRAMVDGEGFEITRWDRYTGNSDCTRIDARTSPGTAFLTAPLYALGTLLPDAAHVLPLRHDQENPALIYALLLPVLLGAATVTGVFRLLRWWGVSPEAAFTTAAVLACGTLHWRYSSVLFSHVVSGCLVFSVFSLAVRADADRLRPFTAAAMGGMLGLAVLVDYSNLLYGAIASAFLWLRRDRLRQLWREPLTSAAFVLALAVPLALWMLYDARVFGEPLQHASAATASDPWKHSMKGIFSGNARDGLGSVLWMSPVLLLALPGFWLWARNHSRRALALAVATVGVYLLLGAMPQPDHTITRDARYFTPCLPLLALGVGVWLQRLFARTPNSSIQWLGYAILFALFASSVRNVASHIALSFNHSFHYRDLKDSAVEPENIAAFFGSLFPNWKDLPRLWAVLAVSALPWVMWLRFAHMRPRLVEKDEKPLVETLG
jgi:hypothetical protein